MGQWSYLTDGSALLATRLPSFRGAVQLNSSLAHRDLYLSVTCSGTPRCLEHVRTRKALGVFDRQHVPRASPSLHAWPRADPPRVQVHDATALHGVLWQRHALINKSA